jgi:oligosaccharide repeat unit polymerase
MYIVTILSGFFFWLGSIFYLKKSNGVIFKKIRITNKFTYLIRGIFIISFSCFIVEWINGGMHLGMMSNLDGGDLKSEIDGAIPGLHYGTIYLPYVAVLTYYRLLNTDKKSIIDLSIIFIIIFTSLFLKISRGDLIIYILSMVFLYSRYYKIKLKHILICMSLFFVMFVGIMMLRVSESSIVLTTSKNPYFSIFYTYIATCYANLNDYIIANNPYHLWGNSTLSPLWSFFAIKDKFDVISIEQLEVFNAKTYLFGFYHDYKIFGVLFFPFIIGFILSNIYYNSVYRKYYWLLILAVLQKAIFIPFFGNYFTGELVILFPYLFTLLIILIGFFPVNNKSKV